MRTHSVAVVAVFTAAIVGSNFALAQFPDVKLLDTLVFICSFVFGLGTGAAVAVLSETIWSFVSPWGVAGSITPFLVTGELLFVVAGWATSKIWRDRLSAVSPTSLFIGAVMAICAFGWDFETNAATALLYNWPQLTVPMLVGYELQGAIFAVAHEVSDFVLGAFLVPVVATILIPRLARRMS
ncbi:MAG: hypothetical protein LYZ69_05560 [Nitrososphaerales archaeon]|nr:hypothetical protein [Nitrososphaerales archaeon]